MDKVNAYGLLNIPNTASLEQIRTSYRAKAFLHHPDRGGKVESFLAIQKAFEILSDAQRRLKEGAIIQFDKLPFRIQPSMSAATSVLFQNLDLLSEQIRKAHNR